MSRVRLTREEKEGKEDIAPPLDLSLMYVYARTTFTFHSSEYIRHPTGPAMDLISRIRMMRLQSGESNESPGAMHDQHASDK